MKTHNIYYLINDLLTIYVVIVRFRQALAPTNK